MDAAPADTHPATFVFVISGSDCISMKGLLPNYFDGLEGTSGGMRIFILHKRFIGTSDCGSQFIEMDYPSRWIEDQAEFILAQLSIAAMNYQRPSKLLLVGISEGAEVVPVLAGRIRDVTHAALLGNGGMDPYDALRLQATKYGFTDAARDIDIICNDSPASFDRVVADRSCRYWSEMRSLRHTDNLLRLDIPLFVAMGEADRMVPIESAWYIRDRFAAAGKTTLRVLTVPDADHGFRARDVSVLPQVWRRLEEWMQERTGGGK
ncbi:alpha/beta hydrolase family protein [Noviherbaspirillum sp.]|uniref:alpha/beta hydrolase family protein n=1 Tax=Noviherbaspirillum sp. TaxID=1926288 RepID=UPI002FE1D61E